MIDKKNITIIVTKIMYQNEMEVLFSYKQITEKRTDENKDL